MASLNRLTARLTAANTLAETDETLSPVPLTSRAELDAFYSEKYRQARGVDRMAHLGVKLTRAYTVRHFHAFVMGHPGVGKSTEISKLLLRPIAFSLFGSAPPPKCIRAISASMISSG